MTDKELGAMTPEELKAEEEPIDISEINDEQSQKEYKPPEQPVAPKKLNIPEAAAAILKANSFNQDLNASTTCSANTKAPSKSPQSMSLKARLEEDMKRWKNIALKIHQMAPAKSINDEDYLQARENYKITREIALASGDFSKLYQARQASTQLACKVTPLVNINIKYKTHLPEAVKIMRYLTVNMHPNLVAHRDVYATPSKLYIFMEFLEGPDLETLVVKLKDYPTIASQLNLLAKKFILDVGEAINFLYVCGVAHCNIKASNVVLIKGQSSVKLAGFNNARLLYDPYADKELLCAKESEAQPHTAPECIQGSYRPILSEVWSLGILLVYLLSKRLPFSGKIKKYDEQLKLHLHRYHVPMEANLMDFLLKCFIVDPLNRIDIAAVLLHPYLN